MSDTTSLAEHRSKELLVGHGVPFLPERAVTSATDAAAAAAELGLPVAIKLTGEHIAHKTERGLVRLGVATTDDAHRVATELLGLVRPDDGEVALLVAPMARFTREFIIGSFIDPTFGPIVLFGVGGVLAEAIDDAVARLVPLTLADALEMLDDLRTATILDAFRGEPPVDREALARVVLAVAEAMAAHPELESIDLNPVAIVDGRPVALDALCVVRMAP